MASSESAPASVDNVTDLEQARRARSARQPASKAAVPADATEATDTENKNTADSEATNDPVAVAKAKPKPARRKPGNRRFDQEKVDRLKAEIADGSYEIDPVRVADKFIEHERN